MMDFFASSSRRFPLPTESTWSPALRRAIHRVTTGPRGALLGPFVPLTRSPELLDTVQALGAVLRYKSSITGAVLETAVLTVASRWSQDYEWTHHAPLALEAGLTPEAIGRISRSEDPAMGGEIDLTWGLVCELLSTGSLSDLSYRSAVDVLGELGIVELVSAVGYYTMLALILNTGQVLPDQEKE